ncbi:DNA-methyltransferase [Celeribacter litoreus]|uniref:DNA-methyltransferase n=1 Tax=Celeribacter litoreus TaxID=2876714 RepID=UPI001CCE9821|nr:site-specific DNA-methyltransferase [Celeribacter litoreus]MCA0045107.1 site-specific DNA-methyltransferase [Celeribacter litoreus]
MQKNVIQHGDARNLLAGVQEASVALSFWSPPYFVGKEYERDATYESWQELLKSVIAGHGRALKPGGFMVINIADILCFEDPNIPRFQSMNIARQRSPITRDMVLDAKAAHPNFNRNQLAELLGCSEQTIDRRLNGNNIRGGKYATQTKVKLVGGNLEKYAEEVGLYLYDKRVWVKDAAWANSKWVSNSLKAVSETEDIYVFWKPGETVIDRSKIPQKEWKEWANRQVWYIDSVRKNDDHEAKFPLELASRVIRLYSSEGDLVLDPFMGSGTTAVAALNWGRDFLGFEKERKYVELAERNIKSFLAEPRLAL